MEKFDRFDSFQARRIGNMIGVDWKKYPLEEFRMGLHVELEHGARDPQTNVTDDDVIMTGKIALAHLKEFPDYYTRLNELEEEAEEYWEAKAKGKKVKTLTAKKAKQKKAKKAGKPKKKKGVRRLVRAKKTKKSGSRR